jgi:hypothetical protein
MIQRLLEIGQEKLKFSLKSLKKVVEFLRKYRSLVKTAEKS